MNLFILSTAELNVFAGLRLEPMSLVDALGHRRPLRTQKPTFLPLLAAPLGLNRRLVCTRRRPKEVAVREQLGLIGTARTANLSLNNHGAIDAASMKLSPIARDMLNRSRRHKT